jgi:predicted Zn-dependent protease
MILNEEDSKRLLAKVLNYSKADSASVSLSGDNSYNIRFALNSVSTDGYSDGLSLSVTSFIGKKSGSVSINKFNDEAIKGAVEKSEQAARVSPDNKEFMPPLESQTYLSANNFSQATEDFTSEKRANYISYNIEQSIKNNVVTAGFFEDGAGFTAVMNSKGLFAYNKNSLASFSSTVRTKEGSGSSRVEKNYVDIGRLDTKSLSDRAIERSVLSVNPTELSPGRYTVILEPAAAADMISLCLNFMGARPAEEGRSFFSKKGGGTKIDELLAKENVNIYSDPTDTNAPSIPFTSEGFPRNRTVWFANGVLKNLSRNRFWADKTGNPVIPYPSNVIMGGAEKSVEQLIAESDYAVLITRFWYIRTVDPATMLLTGLTRDGIFEVKDGKIARPVKNFRFNESPMNVLANILDIGKAEKASGAETGNDQIFVPPLKVANFNLSSLSDAI